MAEQTTSIRPKSICLFRKGDRFLISYFNDPVSGSSTCRPLGGSIEFGESSADAARREIREEIGAEVQDMRLIGVLENIFDANERIAHEIVFVYEGEFQDAALYSVPQIEIIGAGKNEGVYAEWRTADEIAQGSARLVPEMLTTLIDGLPRPRNKNGSAKK